MSESEHATGAHGVDNSPISVVERRLDTINRDLMELNKERIRFLSDKTKNEDQIAALNEQITELKAEKEKKEAKLEELLAPAPAGARHKRTFDEVAQPASPATPPVLPSNYKSTSAPFHIRAFFSEVAAWFVDSGRMKRPTSGHEPTMGNVLAASYDSKEVAEVFTDKEWKYLSQLNEWANKQNHKTFLARDDIGRVTLVCPSYVLNAQALKSVAVKTDVVDDPSKFVVKGDNVTTPPSLSM